LEVVGLVFLNSQTERLDVEKLSASKAMLHLGNNIYRKQWIKGMKVQQEQFNLLSTVSIKVPGFIAYRPKTVNSFESFADLIETRIFQPLHESE